jgi:hypothetical protein
LEELNAPKLLTSLWWGVSNPVRSAGCQANGDGYQDGGPDWKQVLRYHRGGNEANRHSVCKTLKE